MIIFILIILLILTNFDDLGLRYLFDYLKSKSDQASNEAIILSNWLGKKVLPNNFVAYNNNFDRQVLQSKQYLIEQVPLKMDKLTQIEAMNKTYY